MNLNKFVLLSLLVIAMNAIFHGIGAKSTQGGQLEQLEKRVEELEKKVEKQQKLLEEEKRRMASTEYALLIGVPNVANLQANYNKQKLLHLLEHGNPVPSIYIQNNQQLDDAGLAQSIVDLLATAEKPEQMVGKVTIEWGKDFFAWPKREELKLKEKTSNVTLAYNTASSASPTTYSGHQLAEYELSNRGCHFQVLLYYHYESHFHKWVDKFIYRRLA